MKKAILIFVIVALVLTAMGVYFFFGEFEISVQDIGMVAGLILVITFAVILGIRRVRSLRKSQPAEDELSKVVLKRAASTAYYDSLYSWLALMFFSDKTEMEVSSLIGVGIMLMAVEFALAWLYFNFFGKVNE